MIVNTFLHRPRALAIRKLLFQIHLWTGVSAAVYVMVIGVTGSALVFRGELERAARPDLYPTVGAGEPRVPMIDVIRSIRAAYPEDRVASVYGPSDGSPFYAFVDIDGMVRTVFAAPDSGRVLGERPETGWVRWLQLLHTNLLAGTTGRWVNGIGAMLLLGLCVTGILIWWPGLAGWRRATWVDFRKNWKRVIWELHGSVGFWVVLALSMWAFTGVYFVVPQPFQSVVDRLSPLTPTRVPGSDPDAGPVERVDVGAVISRAESGVPGGRAVGVVIPAGDRDSFLVQVAPPGEAGADGRLVHVAYDQYTGELLHRRDDREGSVGDRLLSWMIPLHFGTFGGLPVRILWVLAGLGPVILAASGVLMWWNRVVRSRARWRTGNTLR